MLLVKSVSIISPRLTSVKFSVDCCGQHCAAASLHFHILYLDNKTNLASASGLGLSEQYRFGCS